ncbi:phosphoribosylanthranilate isomerase [Jeotgalibacillus sp. R-1-5s-1]|uniref:phosphoribosylanthranilate isomerase n=1 Tax=Jeotgalibacillus sp. R-1-5s-1 TaxID=2555897 RepID=UPI00106C12C9|nr:phosphoribosylanthranilate isomerase [Jeotgalibacillus sp. R-1-5s-1]TFE03313.1 phosphoribosylanthranilate isomerase [Jeotgalibacillus sp. R-1-5s-1]
MIVKICGLMNKEDVTAAVEAGADYLGFVFAKSKRRITYEQAGKMSEDVPLHVKKVGVFVNPEMSEIEEAIRIAGIDLIQLHGDESPEFCREMKKPVIKAVSIHSEEDVLKFEKYDVHHVLADAPGTAYRGGSGHSFDWNYLSHNDHHEQLILAGGLTPENIQQAINEVKPAGVDVSSGVETNGKKDHQKMKQFVKNAKQTGSEMI